MPFHSPGFLLLCLITFGIYYVGGERWQHGVLLLSSLAFYYYAGLVDTLLLLGAVSVNHVASLFVTADARAGKRALCAIVVVDLGLLAYFKYRRLIVGGPELVIPLGISFYLFQLIAYQVDLHQRKLVRERSFGRMLLYILFFPHHQAGPIMRPAAFLPQFYGRKIFDPAKIGPGALWILWGLCKKVAADRLAMGVDPGFAAATDLHGAGAAWELALRYALQIYGDFSGYSDIAVGLGLLFGYELDRNFEQPYLATNPAAFWQRWHITLSRWLRDYLYIPLGGNRTGPGRTYVNLMLTMLLGGLWHGASLRFVLWGALHGLLLVLHRRWPRLFAVAPLGWAITFGFTVVAWVPFRAPTWSTAVHLIGLMFGAQGIGPARDLVFCAGWVLAILVTQRLEDLLLHTAEGRAHAAARLALIPAFVRGLAFGAVVVAIVLLLVDRTTYIYFRF
jgi:alginate O-acetyltransferase complex protein AlgI